MSPAPRAPITYDIACREVGDGWRPLLDEVYAAIAAAPDEAIVIAQVKEKFGLLRIYTVGCTSIQGLLLDVERRSATICEQCGALGQLTSPWPRGWMRTLCPPCAGPTRFPVDSAVFLSETPPPPLDHV